MADQLVLLKYEKNKARRSTMFYILANFLTLIQSKNISSDHRPKNCVCCGKLDPWLHAKYHRQPDRENASEKSLNPIMIQRYFCNGCKKTIKDLKQHNMVEDHCKHMKTLALDIIKANDIKLEPTPYIREYA